MYKEHTVPGCLTKPHPIHCSLLNRLFFLPKLNTHGTGIWEFKTTFYDPLTFHSFSLLRKPSSVMLLLYTGKVFQLLLLLVLLIFRTHISIINVKSHQKVVLCKVCELWPMSPQEFLLFSAMRVFLSWAHTSGSYTHTVRMINARLVF